MGYRTLRDCIDDLERHRQLIRIDSEIDARLEAAEIHRRVCDAGGPALLFTRVKGCSFPMVSNLFGTMERARFLFRDTLDRVRQLVELKVDPTAAVRRPWRYAATARSALAMVPRFVSRADVTANLTTVSQLPRQVSWPDDGGPFITLPQVYTEDVRAPGWRRSNLGMYRVQLSGGRYVPDREVGLHYQIHRSIGVHHAAAIQAGKPFRANIFVGGSPAMMLAAVLPLPEGMTELAFAGALGGRRIRMHRLSVPLPLGEGRGEGALPIHADTDFCICGTVIPNKLLPEGPFGDHLGYYSKQHDFPVLAVEQVYHRNRAIWPFTVVGRPPQEDTIFGQCASAAPGDWQRAILAVRPNQAAAGAAHSSQRDSRPRTTFACEVFVNRQRRRRSAAESARRRPIPATRSGESRLDPRLALPNGNHHRHARLLRQRA
jgi:4-hydroxy-3-polyprenylbenzoate decarboxylase